LWAFSNNFIIINNLSNSEFSLCFWGEFHVFFLAIYLLISLQNNRYSVRRQKLANYFMRNQHAAAAAQLAGQATVQPPRLPRAEYPEETGLELSVVLPAGN
jgi:hypothetical protein